MENNDQNLKILLEDLEDLKRQVSDLFIDIHEEYSVSSLLKFEELTAGSRILFQTEEKLRETSNNIANQMILEKIILTRGSVDCVIKINTALQELPDLLDDDDLWTAVKVATHIKDLLQILQSEKDGHRVSRACHIGFTRLECDVRWRLDEEWAVAVHFEKPHQLIISRTKEMQQLVAAFEVFEKSRLKLKKVVQLFVDYFLLPFVAGEIDFFVKVVEGATIFTSSKKSTDRLTAAGIFEVLTKGIYYFNQSFLSHKLSPLESETENVFDVTRSLFVEPLIRNIVKFVLSPNELISEEELRASANEVIESCRKFENQMVELGILKNSEQPLSVVAENLESHILEKRRSNTLTSGLELLKTPFLNLSLVGEESCTAYAGNDINVTHFPRCSVSTTVVDILSFIDKEIKNGIESTNEEWKIILFRTVCELIECLPQSLHEFHRDSLESSPQAAAIFHNSCMYVAHCYSSMKTLAPPGLSAYLTQQLRSAANETFLGELRCQRTAFDALLDDLRTMNNSKSMQKLKPVICRCCDRLKMLGRVWQVLPRELYAQVIGTVINHVMGRITSMVFDLEISQEDSLTLIDVLTIFRNQSMSVYRVPATVENVSRNFGDSETSSSKLLKYVESWTRFNELIFIFSADSLEITNRWNDLMKSFTNQELKSLFRTRFEKESDN